MSLPNWEHGTFHYWIIFQWYIVNQLWLTQRSINISLALSVNQVSMETIDYMYNIINYRSPLWSTYYSIPGIVTFYFDAKVTVSNSHFFTKHLITYIFKLLKHYFVKLGRVLVCNSTKNDIIALNTGYTIVGENHVWKVWLCTGLHVWKLLSTSRKITPFTDTRPAHATWSYQWLKLAGYDFQY